MFTIEAFIEYFNHLVPGGILVLSRKLLLPPSDSIRLWATAYESLRLIGIKYPEKHLIMLRNWDTFVLIALARPLQHIQLIQSFANKNNFDFVYRDGISSESVNRFNVFKSPYHYLVIRRLEQSYQTGNEKNFFSSYPLDVAPQTDNRPFPSRFLKWFKLREIYESTGSRIYSLLMSGEIVVLVVFLEAVAISILLLILPLLFAIKKGATFLTPQILYFLSIGMGFMFLEIYYINQFVLLFGNPVMSFTVVLTGVMVFSGIGGILSQYFDQRQLKFIFIIIFVFLIISFFYLSLIIKKSLSFSVSMQYILAFLLLLPPGLLMGIPFPVGMKRLLKNPEQRAYAWVANGCASVLTSIIAAQIALSMGISFIMLWAACSYLLAFLCVVKLNSP